MSSMQHTASIYASIQILERYVGAEMKVILRAWIRTATSAFLFTNSASSALVSATEDCLAAILTFLAWLWESLTGLCGEITMTQFILYVCYNSILFLPIKATNHWLLSGWYRDYFSITYLWLTHHKTTLSSQYSVVRSFALLNSIKFQDDMNIERTIITDYK